MDLAANNINLLGFAVIILLLFLLIIKRPQRNPSELEGFESINELKSSLSEAQQFSARTSALADERKSEIDRLNQDLSKLRLKIDDLNDQLRTQSNEITQLNANRVADQRAAQEKIDMLTHLREGMDIKFKDLAQQALKAQG